MTLKFKIYKQQRLSPNPEGDETSPQLAAALLPGPETGSK